MINLKEFRKKVARGENFTLLDDKTPIRFLIDTKGKAKIVYMYRYYDEKNLFTRYTENKFVFCAIVSEANNVYVIDEQRYSFDCFNGFSEKGYCLYSDFVSDFCNYVNTSLLPKKYEGVPVFIDDEKRKKYIKEARELFLGTPGKFDVDKEMNNIISFSGCQFSSILFGDFTADELGQKLIADQAESIKKAKERLETLKAFEKDKTYAAEWEIALVNALTNSNAVNVLVEFEADNGNKASEKIAVEKIIGTYRYNDFGISRYDFLTTDAGDKLFEALGLNRWYNLQTNNISSITYRGKVIYKKADYKEDFKYEEVR